MDQLLTVHGAELQEILLTGVQKRIPAIMSYLSRNKWHVAKVQLTDIVDQKLILQAVHSGSAQHPMNIRVEQPVGVSFKYAYGKFIFDTTVVGLGPAVDPAGGGTIAVVLPNHIGVLQRRSYFRVNVPESLKVKVVLWHRGRKFEGKDQTHTYYQGRLVDISAGGAQVAIQHQESDGQADHDAIAENFRKGQFIGIRFTPLPYERPLVFNAQIRNILPTADNQYLCLGLQIVGLEASAEGHEVLSRIAYVVEQYYNINQSGTKQQDMQGNTRTEGIAFGTPTDSTDK